PGYAIPVPDVAIDFSDLPELPPNPTKEQLWEYAENHPLVKHVKRTFRGSIVNIRPSDQNSGN
ncbi:MAG TPA: hypothetical protein PKM58_06420, partial [Pyrinomonadaceae bacterium]|nr:hypothetical protein [Pyrinomonadaceae bacterium]